MSAFNQVLLMGNLTRDPELANTAKGTAVAKFGIAITRQWKNDAGEKKEEVTFIDVEAWGRTAELVGRFSAKGHPIFISGHLKLDQWEDKNGGGKRSKLKVVADNIQFMKFKEDGAAPGGGETQERPARRQSAATAPASDADADDNIPF